MEFFDSTFLKKLEYLHIVSKQVFLGQMRADRRTRIHGSGLEFADHRGYSPGDDFRHVDWKVYQRLGRLLLRLFEEEQDLPIYLLLDQSQSMAAGEPSKFTHGQRVAAALCYVGLANLDRVTLAGYSDSVTEELNAQRGKSQIFRVFRFLSRLEAGGHTDARESFRQFCSRPRPRGTAVVISDLLDPGGFEEPLNLLRFAQHDVFVVHITTPSETDPDVRGDLRLVDSETGAAKDISVTPALMSAYRTVFARFCDDVARYCSQHAFGYIRTSTATPFEDVVLQGFRQGRFLA